MQLNLTYHMYNLKTIFSFSLFFTYDLQVSSLFDTDLVGIYVPSYTFALTPPSSRKTGFRSTCMVSGEVLGTLCVAEEFNFTSTYL
jgi:hypothetical protein